ncbi:putative 2-nitropropane dioxygenase family oxidoreductase [Aspergillus steynii IBT 23096]|uniref:Putative 2-nitropropane dioxygenase family oxidoreductase n=1 Tax=Aspergillus steynii IBT 23096 TaxID=1392250 RepID=A0A2I2GQY3_9EURO|nr:putative 2-nitropropane dioxygenase family oxidoreductase [Aspergillus steynii IBT 23096]PLB55290.1 putative 2-nitropropane dioxygenase family oxidoreductase [Aspergillus steynii IBT 23096]
MSPVENLTRIFPGTTAPLICNAPMAGATNAALAGTVTKAGGLGFISGGANFAKDSEETKQFRAELDLVREQFPTQTPLPIGIGALTMLADSWTEDFVALVAEYRPAAVWLFGNKRRDQHQTLVAQLKAVGQAWGLQVIAQVGNVSLAREAVQDGIDILAVQGTDAGGHQFRQGASLMTLLPDVADMLSSEFPDRRVPILAAGGIMDGRGVAASLALGADGVVMGTRFLGTKECPWTDEIKSRLLAADNGASSTAKSPVHDVVTGMKSFWPGQYDGRAIITESFEKTLAGADEDEIIRQYKELLAAPDGHLHKVIWAGAGVGQLTAVVSAETVVTETRAQSLQRRAL